MHLKKYFIGTLPTLIIIFSPKVMCQNTIFDDFTDPVKSDTLWEFANRTWSSGDPTNPTHGGVVPDLASIKNGLLILKGNGKLYSGDISGHGRNTLVGSCLVSKKEYASGSYEFRARILPKEGAVSAFWTFAYETYNSVDSGNINHEIDIEVKKDNTGFNQAYCNTWVYEKIMTHTINNEFYDQDDGEFHLYRFEWHSGGEEITPSVSFYYDDQLKEEILTTVPNRLSKLWVGVWFPAWAGNADFETDSMVVDWIKITPFHEANDEKRKEPGEQEPYHNQAISVPGRIQAEDFDLGGEGISYHDKDNGNTGMAYRPNESVDIESWPDNRYSIGYIKNNEWLEYSINTKEEFTNSTTFCVASGLDGGSLHLEIDGFDITNEITFPGTGTWGNFRKFSGPDITVPEGNHILRVFFNSGDINLDYIDIGPPTQNDKNTINTNPLNNELLLFPNPVKTGENVYYEAEAEAENIIISDIQGKIVKIYEMSIASDPTFSAPNLAGSYIVKLQNKNKLTSRKLIVYK